MTFEPLVATNFFPLFKVTVSCFFFPFILVSRPNSWQIYFSGSISRPLEVLAM